MQYLGTYHPTKGMLVYTVQPQGLLTASQDAYEKLTRIFSDMLEVEALTRMADGLHVLGETVEQLLINYIEVLRRIEFCGLTLKPSKVEICPRVSFLFGWKLEAGEWTPTEHTTSANCPISGCFIRWLI